MSRRVRRVSVSPQPTRRTDAPIAPHDIDLLLLIREEEVYAVRIRDALVFNESKIERNPVPLAIVNQATREARRALYVRPTSVAERRDEIDSEVDAMNSVEGSQRSSRCGRSRTRQSRREYQDEKDLQSTDDDEEPIANSQKPLVLANTTPYINPPVDRRRTVEDSDTLYNEEAASARTSRAIFSYEDLVAAQAGEKAIVARALRPLANLWGIDTKLNKAAMLEKLISAYARRYPDEVLAHEARRSTPKKAAKQRRHGRRR